MAYDNTETPLLKNLSLKVNICKINKENIWTKQKYMEMISFVTNIMVLLNIWTPKSIYDSKTLEQIKMVKDFWKFLLK